MSSEIMQMADQLAREKGIEREVVIEAMETAIQTASRRKYGPNKNIQVKFNNKSGEFMLHQLREVVEDEAWDDEELQIGLQEAQQLNPSAQVGDLLADALPPIEFGRVAAQTAKQVIVQRVRDAERERIFEEYVSRRGQLVNGLVKRVERNHVYVDLGRAAAFLPYEEQLPREHFRQGDRIRAYIKDVRDNARGPQIILSRTHPQMVAKLFEMEVPEIYDGVLEIKAVARDPGFRSKIAVYSHDSHVDPVGACVGMRGSRVQGVVNELQGERIDIIQWSSDPAVFVCNALAPAEVSKVILDEEEKSIKVVVSEDQLSLSIGRRGQNVRLASELTGWSIDIVTEEEEGSKREVQYEALVAEFVAQLDLDEEVAASLVNEGYSTIEEVAYVPLEELSGIEGFDEEVARALRNRARDRLLQRALEMEERKVALAVDPRMNKLVGLPEGVLMTLVEKGVRDLDALADLAVDELAELVGDSLLRREQEQVILEARRLAGWFDGENEAEGRSRLARSPGER